ncbi:peptidyl-prolyl cis-trans isomerase [Cytobacillus purgationiresistens]|uniref:Peptidyl-prolyl cis-trans isomerase n=1 Tax=Cytobacillus purgationiresistens TaxID=863449 RepID=A0ABU0AMF4_9BACI|nr:peptidyl-prolyl cis-trans isomerase [Cytobacillus purgationiresistens]MDQ0272417.1 hypothetical protein [Cytobacillus purgationiresistens]
MEEKIIHITGKVKFTITLDPGVWIFDDRRIDLNTYFDVETKEKDEIEEYTKAASKHWDREIMEGAVVPPTLKSEKRFEKVKVMTGTFGIPFHPFLKNAEPEDDASEIIIECVDQEVKVPIAEAESIIIGFSKDGKPLNEDGPAYIFYKDGSNKNEPIKHVREFKII